MTHVAKKFNSGWRWFSRAGACLALACMATAAHTMDIEVRSPFVVLSGPVTGIELRLLQDALEKNPGITTVVLKNSRGGDARTGYVVGEFIREHGLSTTVSGHCMSSCSRMFLGGKNRSFSNDQPLEKTFVGFHGNYGDNGVLLEARMPMLKAWVLEYSDGKAHPDLVERWTHIANHKGFMYFYHQQAHVPLGPEKVMLCQGTEEPKARARQCDKLQLGDALTNGILTTWDLTDIKLPDVN